MGTLSASMRIALALLVVLAACTAPTAEPATTTTLPPTTTTTVPTPAQAVSSFVNCLRDAGVEVADPDPALPGELESVAASLDTTEPAVRSAIAGCANLLAPAQTAVMATDPEVRALVAEQLGAFAACMRDNGVEAFPDPVEDLGSGGPPFPVELVPFDADGFEDAMERCRELLGSLGTG